MPNNKVMIHNSVSPVADVVNDNIFFCSVPESCVEVTLREEDGDFDKDTIDKNPSATPESQSPSCLIETRSGKPSKKIQKQLQSINKALHEVAKANRSIDMRLQMLSQTRKEFHQPLQTSSNSTTVISESFSSPSSRGIPSTIFTLSEKPLSVAAKAGLRLYQQGIESQVKLSRKRLAHKHHAIAVTRHANASKANRRWEKAKGGGNYPNKLARLALHNLEEIDSIVTQSTKSTHSSSITNRDCKQQGWNTKMFARRGKNTSTIRSNLERADTANVLDCYHSLSLHALGINANYTKSKKILYANMSLHKCFDQLEMMQMNPQTDRSGGLHRCKFTEAVKKRHS